VIPLVVKVAWTSAEMLCKALALAVTDHLWRVVSVAAVGVVSARQSEAVLLGLLKLIRLLLSDIGTSTESDLPGWEHKRHEQMKK
jgi:hypothetical protein